ncbi:class I SAM-dependent methyltransferase [Halomarina oriensis]|uniref:Methyltransferase domain-containing protein n=1 Tax=Halomarina oriensis TaxID=671145 RepID=A0A6B0GFN0_9EURY|nr:class I SAM-dependent methyltransferase [Halomarina oriensis]MWG33320.1 methyltransferase domain-containing protein [Halomarina oriensis]
MGESEILDGAIAERPREVAEHPLLAAIYDRHDALIRRHVRSDGRTLELAFGRHAHPDADVGVEAFHENSLDARDIEATTADARSLPFADDAFDTVVGRRFLHHVPPADRRAMLAEARRVLAPGGRLILLEGTPGLYRRFTKALAFRLGALGEDTDEYGHLSVDDVSGLLDAGGFETLELRRLGSPLMPLSLSKGEWSARAVSLYERTQFVRWWTLAVATPAPGVEVGTPGSAVEKRRSPSGQRHV